MTKETFCSYEQSNRLKRLGFNWPCWCVYHKAGNGKVFLNRMAQADNFNTGINVSAPSCDVAHRWLRETMKLSIGINPQKDTNGKEGFNFSVFYLPDQTPVGWSYEIYSSYDKAMSGALDYAIECGVIQYRKQKANTP